MRKTMIISVVGLVMAVAVAYFGRMAYEGAKYQEAAMVHVKNVSLRVANASRFDTEDTKVTFKELFARLEDDIAETEKRILDVQTISPPNRKTLSEGLIDYMKTSQDLLRAMEGKYKKALDVTVTKARSDRLSKEFFDEPGYSAYALRAASAARDESLHALDEYQKAGYEFADAVTRLGSARSKLVKVVSADALVDEDVLNRLSTKNPTRQQDEERKAAEEVKRATASASAAPEQLAKDKGCLACHAVDRKIVGPAYRDVAKRYARTAGADEKLVAKVISGGKGVWGEIPMPPNAVTQDEAKRIVVWVLSRQQY